MSTPHELVEFSLGAAAIRDGRIAAEGVPGVISWRCIELPAASGATVRTGRQGPRVPIEKGYGWEWDPCAGTGPESQGIWLDTPAPIVGVARFVVFYAVAGYQG